MIKNNGTVGIVKLCANGAIAFALGLSTTAYAQEAAPPAPPPEAAAPAPAPAPPAPAPVAAPAPTPPPPAAAPAPAATVTAQASVAEEANSAKYKSISNAMWLRIGNRVANKMGPAQDQSDILVDAEVDAIFSGRVHKYIGWQANFVGTIDSKDQRQASILDLHAKIELHDTFNVWVGRMLVPSDRSNFSGPWFTSTWNYPGGSFPSFVGPKTGPFGRDNGTTVWGQVLGGHFKYYVGAFNLENPNHSPLYVGRINIALINPEPGFYHSSTYYGTKDIVAVGIGGQTQKNGVYTVDPMTEVETVTGDHKTFNVDFLAEKNVAGVGTFTAEGAFFKFNKAQTWDNHFFGLVSYLTPNPLWVGYLQPLVRVQTAKANATKKTSTIMEGQISYVLDQYAARLALGYQRRDFEGTKSNAFVLGVQVQK